MNENIYSRIKSVFEYIYKIYDGYVKLKTTHNKYIVSIVAKSIKLKFVFDSITFNEMKNYFNFVKGKTSFGKFDKDFCYDKQFTNKDSEYVLSIDTKETRCFTNKAIKEINIILDLLCITIQTPITKFYYLVPNDNSNVMFKFVFNNCASIKFCLYLKTYSKESLKEYFGYHRISYKWL